MDTTGVCWGEETERGGVAHLCRKMAVGGGATYHDREHGEENAGRA